MDTKYNYHMIGRRIKYIRENNNMTQAELASYVGCTSQHISVIERGIKLPKLDTFVKIINALHISSDILLQDMINPVEIDLCNYEISLLIQSVPSSKKTMHIKGNKNIIRGYFD